MNLEKNQLDTRKADHINLTYKSQVDAENLNQNLVYEPLLSSHENTDLSKAFLGKRINAPIWISSMTGGTGAARHINQNLAKLANEFGLPMGLGSCRALLEDNDCFEDFNLRPIIGDDLPFYANLGIAQIEQLLIKDELEKIDRVVSKLKADGLIIHVNPLQEALQPEGDRYNMSALEVITRFLEQKKYKVIIKEVGQGMGPQSIEALIRLNIDALDFGAFGGTNFSKLELLRSKNPFDESLMPLVNVGHTASQMVHSCKSIINHLGEQALCREFIISGGIKNFLDGHELMGRLEHNCVYGQASAFLKYANDSYEDLKLFTQTQIRGLQIANQFVRVKK